MNERKTYMVGEILANSVENLCQLARESYSDEIHNMVMEGGISDDDRDRALSAYVMDLRTAIFQIQDYIQFVRKNKNVKTL